MKKTWKAVSVSKYFTPIRGHEGNMAGLESGNVPLVSARNVNNGLKTFVSNPGKIVEGNVISLNNDGDGGAGLAYYQPFSMALDTHVTALVPHDELNANTQLYTACCLSGLHEFFGHGRSISNARVRRVKFMLPIAEDGSPDWEYMSSVVNDIREKLLVRYKNHVTKQLSKLEYKKIPELAEMEWRPFHVSRIFTEIGRGKRLKKADHVPGNMPYVSSTAMNNGVDAFITATPGTRIFGDCLSLANSGSVGSTFYEPFDYVASDHVTHLKHDGFNKWVYLFLVAVVEKQGVNFNFNREINDTRINKMQIMLPVVDNGKPDYDYMEQYAKNLMFRKYKQYLTYARHEKT